MAHSKVRALDMSRGNAYTLLIRFSVPLLIGNVLQQLYNIVDSVIVGRYVGDAALAAVGTAFPILFLYMALFVGIGIGATILVAQAFGAKRFDRVQVAVDTIYRMTFLLGLILTVISYLTTEPMLHLINVPQEAFLSAKTYLHIVFLGTLPVFGYNINAAILRGLGDSKSQLGYLAVSVFTNIGLDLLFVKGFGLGVGGAAWATVLAQLIAFVTGLVHINRRLPYARFRPIKGAFDLIIAKSVVRLGLPSAAGTMSYSLGSLFLINLVNSFGTSFTAGFGAANKIDTFVFLPSLTLANAITTYVGQNIGANQLSRIREGVRACLVMSLILSAVTTPLALIFGPNLIAMFSPTDAVVAGGMAYLNRVLPPMYLLAILMTVNGTMRGAGQAVVPFLSQVVSLWVFRIPLAYLFSSWFGRDWMYASFAAGWLLGLLIALPYYLSGRWRSSIHRTMHEIAVDAATSS